jgi:hypothetical protein
MRFRSLTAAFFYLPFLCGAAQAEPDFSGVWVLEGGPAEHELVMTEKALAIQAEYDLLNDDPSRRACHAYGRIPAPDSGSHRKVIRS